MLSLIKLRSLTKNLRNITSQAVKLPESPELDSNYLFNPKNESEIQSNISSRKGQGNIVLVKQLKSKLEDLKSDSEAHKNVERQLIQELLKIPNRTHPDVVGYKDEPNVIKTIGNEKTFDFKPREFYEITKRMSLARTDQLGTVSGSKSYYFTGELAELEHALVQFTLSNLSKRKFKLMSVPDILERRVIEGCGFKTTGDRNQVYFLDKRHGNELCLSGTSEMALAGYFANKVMKEEDLPIKVTTASRCYRAETSSLSEEKGVYRVHEFTKVEMFGVCTPEYSDKMLEEFRSIEEENFSTLGLYIRTMDMPPFELGAPAYRKYDVETWLPGRKTWGEISSCSNCTDYQSRRLNIKYKNSNCVRHVHTLNGTACAIPRMLIALLETYQNDNGTIDIPEVLRKYMRGRTKITKQKGIPPMKLMKNKK